MKLIRELLQAVREERIRAHRRWLTRNRVILPLPKPDPRNWSDEYMRSLRHG